MRLASTVRPPPVSTDAAVELWFDFASPYSYLSLMRVGDLAARAGVAVALCPFLLGPIFKAQGWQDTPFRLYPLKGAYILRDVARRAARYGLPYREPSAFPRMSLLAARVATMAAGAPWQWAFCRAIFRESFELDRDIAQPEIVREVLAGLGLPADALIAQAGQDEAKQALKDMTGLAMERGVFGAPAFFVGDELFWGDDRLEDALEWALSSAQAAPA